MVRTERGGHHRDTEARATSGKGLGASNIGIWALSTLKRNLKPCLNRHT